ncbi:MAG: tRNA pseudouridine(13) synthase TruD [Candidatus Diapherotrites archaeon]
MEKVFYFTKCPGTGGQIKRLYTDFVVEEISVEGRVCEAKAFLSTETIKEQLVVPEKPNNMDYLHLDLEKINKDLHSVIRQTARFLQVSGKRIGYAGIKDKRAVTCQRISIWNPNAKLLEAFRPRGIRFRNASWQKEKIDLGMHKGNRFTITVRDVDLEIKEIEERVLECFKEMENGIANFFGEQRFGGIRAISHVVGREIVKGNLENAVMLYLSAESENEETEVKKARAIAKTRDFKTALKEFPQKYRYERAILNSLCQNPSDFASALQAIPLRLRFLFTHAFQSYLYNEILKERLKQGIGLKPVDGEPQEGGIALGLLAGYDSVFSPGRIGEIERKVLEREGVCFADFRIEKLGECSSRGARRKILIVPEKMRLLETGEDKVFNGKKYFTVSFELEKGAYATVLLKEILKNPKAISS